MRFCPECQAYMTKSTATGTIVFKCRCQLMLPGTPEDSLMYEELLETRESNLKFEDFIKSSPFDPAANIVKKDCPNCGLDFMIMIRVGSSEIVMYTCDCGFEATQDEYLKVVKGKNTAAAPVEQK